MDNIEREMLNWIYFPEFKQIKVLSFYDYPREILAKRENKNFIIYNVKSNKNKQIWIAVQLTKDEYKACINNKFDLKEIIDNKNKFIEMEIPNDGIISYTYVSKLKKEYYPD